MHQYDANQIIADLDSGDTMRERSATDAIARMNPASEVDEYLFVAALDSPNDKVVYWSGVALKLIGPRGATAIPALLGLLTREQLFLRQTAVRALAGVGPHDSRARAAIFAGFGDESAFIRREALQASLTLPDLTDDDLAAIAGMCTDPDEEVSKTARQSISKPTEQDV